MTLRPEPFQQEILDRLAAERSLHHRRRNLVVAATGTGKTVIAALDYARVAAERRARPRLLYLAHRREILEQARDTFRHALQDRAFGDLLGEGARPTQERFVFATIPGAAGLLDRLPMGHFRYVVLDECHHAPAASYRALLDRLQDPPSPRGLPEEEQPILLGLTATPERMDGDSLLPLFAGHIAAELRLWEALNRQLLVPFEYYGLHDGTDLRPQSEAARSKLRWSRAGYADHYLTQIYTSTAAACGASPPS